MTRVVGYVPGAYDMFHIGHLNILRRASRDCDYLIAGVVTDEVMEVIKGRPPVVPLDERLEIVRSISCVDEAVVDVSSNKLEMWRQLRFDVIFKGDDWKGTERGHRLEKDLGGVGVRVVYYPYTPYTSSTALRQLLAGSLPSDSAPAGRKH